MDIPLTLRQIEILLAVADEGSTAAASRRLNVSQPSVSLTVSRCEDVFGHKIFLRRPGRGMELTAFGQHKLTQLRELEKQARWVLSGEQGTPEFLELGVFSTLGPRYAPQLVRHFQKANPKAEVQIREGDLQSLFEWLREGRIDLALIYDFGVPSQFAITPLMSIAPYALVAQGHPLTDLAAVTPHQITEHEIVLMGLPQSRGYFLSLLQNDRHPVRISYETSSIEMLRSMVAHGFGVGLLATDLLNDTCYDGTSLVRIPISGILPPHQIALAHRGGAAPRSIVQRFVRFAETSFAQSKAPNRDPQ